MYLYYCFLLILTQCSALALQLHRLIWDHPLCLEHRVVDHRPLRLASVRSLAVPSHALLKKVMSMSPVVEPTLSFTRNSKSSKHHNLLQLQCTKPPPSQQPMFTGVASTATGQATGSTSVVCTGKLCVCLYMCVHACVS